MSTYTQIMTAEEISDAIVAQIKTVNTSFRLRNEGPARRMRGLFFGVIRSEIHKLRTLERAFKIAAETKSVVNILKV